MDENAKYGNTNPVANCAKDHGIPVDVGFLLADRILHGRSTIWTERAEAALQRHVGPQHQVDFIAALSAVTARIA